MARIRSIKPEFWTSEQVVECSPTARLLFVGMWNFCDDSGIHPASTKTLKMQVFPGDDMTTSDIQGMVNELIKNGLLVEYEYGGKPYWMVTGWHHQKIEKPNFKHPKPEQNSTINLRRVSDTSSIIRRLIDDSSPPEGKGEEGSSTTTSPDGDRLACPVEEIVSLFHECMPDNPKCKVLNPARRSAIKARWLEASRLTCKPFGYATRQGGLSAWRSFFEICADSDFLTGRAKTLPGKPPFFADIEFLMSPSGFAKCLENKYHREVAA